MEEYYWFIEKTISEATELLFITIGRESLASMSRTTSSNRTSAVAHEDATERKESPKRLSILAVSSPLLPSHEGNKSVTRWPRGASATAVSGSRAEKRRYVETMLNRANSRNL